MWAFVLYKLLVLQFSTIFTTVINYCLYIDMIIYKNVQLKARDEKTIYRAIY